MKYFTVIVGVLALMAMAQAQNEENETTTLDPSEEDGNSSSTTTPHPPPPPPPSNRPKPPGPRPKPPGHGHRPPHHFGNRFGPPHSHEGHLIGGPFRPLRGSIQGPGFGLGFGTFQDQGQIGPFRRRPGPQHQEFGNDNPRSQRPFGNLFGPLQSNAGLFSGIRHPDRSLRLRQPVLFDFGSGNDFGQGNAFGRRPSEPQASTILEA